MNWKAAGGIRLAVSTLLHVLFLTGHLHSIWIFPGLIAHVMIAGFDRPPLGLAETFASVVEILINGALYMLVTLAVARPFRTSKTPL